MILRDQIHRELVYRLFHHKRCQDFIPRAQGNVFRRYAVIRVYDAIDNVLETHEHAGDFKEW
jgi:hypothetical protein